MASQKERFLREFPKSLADDNAAIFVGAGVSAGAGYPTWSELLREIGRDLGVNVADVHDLAALAQWSVSEGGGTRIRQTIKDEVGLNRPVPPTLEILARLPVRHIWTTNYDRLIERAFGAINRPYDVVSSKADLALKVTPGAARIYKMHGSVDHLDDIVISTDDYELFRSKRGAFLPLLEAHLSSFSMLFVGLSFTDPNLRHVLSLIRESFTDAPPSHFAIVRPPHRRDFSTEDEFNARLTQHKLWAKDLRRYGLFAIEVEDYDEIPDLLQQLERIVARRRVWVSGSWPLDQVTSPTAEFVHNTAERVGRSVGDLGLTLVSGAGLLVGSGAISGFLSSLQSNGGWDLERRLIARPFPQPLGKAAPDRDQWNLLREELARLSGTVVFIGGMKSASGALVEADGVQTEMRIAASRGAYLLPIGATGGAAETIANNLIGSALATGGRQPQRPTDQQLTTLMDKHLSAAQLAAYTQAILSEVSRG